MSTVVIAPAPISNYRRYCIFVSYPTLDKHHFELVSTQVSARVEDKYNFSCFPAANPESAAHFTACKLCALKALNSFAFIITDQNDGTAYCFIALARQISEETKRLIGPYLARGGEEQTITSVIRSRPMSDNWTYSIGDSDFKELSDILTLRERIFRTQFENPQVNKINLVAKFFPRPTEVGRMSFESTKSFGRRDYHVIPLTGEEEDKPYIVTGYEIATGQAEISNPSDSRCRSLSASLDPGETLSQVLRDQSVYSENHQSYYDESSQSQQSEDNQSATNLSDVSSMSQYNTDGFDIQNLPDDVSVQSQEVDMDDAESLNSVNSGESMFSQLNRQFEDMSVVSQSGYSQEDNASVTGSVQESVTESAQESVRDSVQGSVEDDGDNDDGEVGSMVSDTYTDASVVTLECVGY